jgi:hypothetical protein
MNPPSASPRHELDLKMLAQPDNSTCGPTCLHAVYRYFDQDISLSRMIREVPKLADGGTLGVLLASHAVKRGFTVTVYSYNLQIFDPTWESFSTADLIEKLEAQEKVRRSPKRKLAIRAYVDFLRLGGRVKFAPMSGALIRRYLRQNYPIIAGLSSTYLYQSAREWGPHDDPDDLRGDPMGHFVVLHGYDQVSRQISIADPLQSNPHSASRHYQIGIERVMSSILLGVLTYDANLIVLKPPAHA